ncbi:FAD synthase-like isoform X2 [Panulirus ornatus]|uniref:FAD synthase-like isoform X2 n=1 Tax=Panulirus ornatus TaxID=150431 RepID=UPI003A8BA0D6
MGRTCGIIIIGDEVLRGQIADTNSFFMCRRLFCLGVTVARVTVLPDVVQDIAEEVSRFSSKYDIVITSGGIGPTHDDVTYEGVACAFQRSLEYNKEVAEVVRQHIPRDHRDDHPAYKMAYIPQGIPAYLERAFHYLEKLFYDPSSKMFVRNVFFLEEENNITGTLNDLVCQSPRVIVGSYPEVNNCYYRTKVTLQSQDEDDLNQAETFLKSSVGQQVIVDYDVNSNSKAGQRIYDIVELRGEPHLTGPVTEAVKVIEDCFNRYTVEEICVSFNGGKDCMVILHLLHGALMHRFPENTPAIQAVYITCANPFDELEKFIDDTVDRYKLNLWRYNGPIKQGLEQLTIQKPHIKAILMGTRSTDPYSQDLKAFQMTDSGWPQVMRVMPILTWNYQIVWEFLRSLSVHYCVLYDHGYTSLGGQHNTAKNPHLCYHDEAGNKNWYPAYFLKDSALERTGRT